MIYTIELTIWIKMWCLMFIIYSTYSLFIFLASAQPQWGVNKVSSCIMWHFPLT